MAEEVKIVDVAGGPAAEATLQELLKVTRSMAAKSGKSTGGSDTAEAKTQQVYNKAVKEGTTAKRGFIKEVKAGASAIKGMASAVGSLAKGVLGAFTSIIGYGVGIATTLFKAFGDGTGTLTDMVGQIPIFGSLLASLTGIFDDTLKTFQGLATSGASFNNNLTELRVAAAGAKVSLDSFASLIGSNTEKFAAFGGTVTEGAKNFVQVRKSMGAYEQQLLNMGLSFEDINEGLMNYMSLQRAGSRVDKRSSEEVAIASAKYTKNLMTLSKITGEDVKSQQEKIAAASADVAFQMKLSKMSASERAKVEAGLAEALAAGGATGGLAFKQLVLGIAPVTRETKLFAASMPGAYAAIGQMAKQAQDAGISVEQYEQGQVDRLANFVEGAAAAGQDLETLLAASASGMEGPGAEMAAILQGMGKQFTDYMDTDGKFNKQKLIEDLEAAKKENAATDDVVQGLTAFQSTLRNIKESIERNFVAPIATMIGPQLDILAKNFKSTNDNILKPAMERIGRVLNTFVTDINTVGFSKAFDNIFEKIKQKIAEMISGGDTTDIKTALKTLMNDAFSSLGKMLVDGFVSMFSNPKVLAGLAAAVAGMFAVGKISSMISNKLSGPTASAGPTRGSRTAGGRAGSNVGGALGGLGGGIIEGIGNGLAAVGAKAPLVAAGAAAIGAAIIAIGAGVAGATWILGKALPTFSEGLKSFETLDGNKLQQAGLGMLSISAGMAAFGAGSVVGGLGSLVGGIADGVGKLFGAEDPMTKLQRFAEYNIDADRVKNNAEAMVAFSAAMAAGGAGGAGSGMGAAVGAIGNSIAGFFGGSTGLPYDQITKFASYNFDAGKIKTNADAMVAFNQALSSSSGAGAASGAGNAIASMGNAISKFFGGKTPFDQVKSFGDLQLNAEGVRNNATAMVAMSSALAEMSSTSAGNFEIPRALVSRIKELSAITGGGLPTVASGMEAIAKVQGLQTNLDILNKGLDANSVKSYASAMSDLVKTLDDLNKVLAEDNKGMFAKGTGVGAADVVKAGGLGGKSPEDQLQKLDQLNTTMIQVLATLQEGTEYGRRTSKAVRASGNLQMGI